MNLKHLGPDLGLISTDGLHLGQLPDLIAAQSPLIAQVTAAHLTDAAKKYPELKSAIAELQEKLFPKIATVVIPAPAPAPVVLPPSAPPAKPAPKAAPVPTPAA